MKDLPNGGGNQTGEQRVLKPQLKALLAEKVELSEISATLADLSNTVAAGVLPPHLVKTAATKWWMKTITKSAK